MSKSIFYGVCLGRMSPIHLGHEVIIRKMLEDHGIDNSILIIGSSNTLTPMRNFFSYDERRLFIKSVFPKIRIIGLPDYNNNENEWFLALDDILASIFTPSRNDGLPCLDEIEFYGGCQQDVSFFIENKRNTKILNRFDGTTPEISSTKVRDYLITGKSIKDLVNPILVDPITEVFNMRWNIFKNT